MSQANRAEVNGACLDDGRADDPWADEFATNGAGASGQARSRATLLRDRGVGRAGRRDESAERDAERLFTAEIARLSLLSCDEECALTRRLALARARVRAIMRRAPRLVAAALAGAGRGVVRPERDFREREVLVVLRAAERALASRAGGRASGVPRATLVRQIAALRVALAEYRELRDRMMQANVRLVARLARRYRHPTLTFLDLFQEGTFGLLRAVEKYEPARGIKFSTYASWWIWQQLGRSADQCGALIRTPVHWNQMRRRIARAHASAHPSTGESAGALGMGAVTMMPPFQYLSTDTAAEADEWHGAALLPNADADPEVLVHRAVLTHRLAAAVGSLPTRERLIVEQRFGFADGRSRTLGEIGAQLGVSRERVRQLEARALDRLRAACAGTGLRDHLS